MSDRVSIKGKGEDIFFGDNPDRQGPAEDNQADALARANPDTVAPRRQDTAEPESERASHRVGEPRRTNTAAPAGDETLEFFEGLVLPGGLKRRLGKVLDEDHRFHTSVRLSREDTDALRDLMYELDAKIGVRVPRSEVFRVALRLLIEDYAIRKKESLLVQILLGEEGQH